jgi:tripartite-type tricarboxylate transporter receptor subunit TctC
VALKARQKILTIERKVMLKRFGFFLSAIVLTIAMVLSGCNRTDSSGRTAVFPDSNRSVTIIVERAAGGGSDLTARAIAPILERELGIPVVVVNVTGGDGVVGLNQLAAAAADGYTLGLSADTVQAIHSVMYDHTNYDENSWEYLSTINVTSYIVILPRNSRFTSLEELLSHAVENPRRLTLGTPSGIMEVMSTLEENTGAIFTQIVHDSGGANLASIAGGHVDLGILTAQFYQQSIDMGLNVVGVMSDGPFPGSPDVPTFRDIGHDVVVNQYWILIMPRGAPDYVMEPLRAAVNRMGNSPEFVESLERINAIPAFRDGKEGSEYILHNINRIRGSLENWNVQ